MPEDEDRSRAADPSWADMVAPDDLRELTADIAAYHRELRVRRRQVRIQRLVGRRRAFPLMVVAAALLVAVIVASLLTLLTGGTVDRSPTALALAHPTTAAGQTGGLLPDLQVIPAGVRAATSARTTPLRGLRPAVLALIGPKCNCSGLIAALDGQAYEESLTLDVIVRASADDFAESLDADQHRGPINVYFDPTGSVGSALGATGVTAVAVDRHGVIADVLPSATTANARSLGGVLETMLLSARAGG